MMSDHIVDRECKVTDLADLDRPRCRTPTGEDLLCCSLNYYVDVRPTSQIENAKLLNLLTLIARNVGHRNTGTFCATR